MKRRPLGWTEEPVSIIGQGTWNLETADRREGIRTLHAGLDAGMNLIDTAEMYGDGAVESLVGEALAGRRNEAFVVTKVLPSHASRRGTVEACERSLRRLRTDVIDLYLLHWPGRYPLAETVAAFRELQAKGKIRYFGVSNFDARELDEALDRAGPRGVACDQVLYHLKERAIEHAVLPWCERKQVALMAYSPFGSGDFPKATSEGGKALAAIAEAHRASPRQVALAYLLRHEAVLLIPKAGSVDHAKENAGASEVSLRAEEVARLEQAFPLGREPAHLPTL